MSAEIQKTLEGFVEIMVVVDDNIEAFENERDQMEPELLGNCLDRDSCIDFVLGKRPTGIDFATGNFAGPGAENR